MPHEGAAPGTPGAPHTPSPPPPPWSPSGSVFGWSWLGRYAADDAPGFLQTFIDLWVDKFNTEVLDPLGIQKTETLFIQEFLAALNDTDTEVGEWWTSRSGVWQALKKLEYGTGAGAANDYRKLINRTKEYMRVYSMGQGYTRDWTDAEVEQMIIDTAGVSSSGVIELVPNESNRWIEDIIIGARSLEEEEGEVGVTGGVVQDLYNKLKGWADDNFTSVDPELLWDLVTQIKREEISEASAYDTIMDEVLTSDTWKWITEGNPHLAERLKGNTGVSLRTHLYPLKQALSTTWELDEDEIDLKDYFSDMIQTAEGEDDRFKNSREAKQWARRQDQFKLTNNYKSNMSEFTSSIFSMFGAR